MESLVLACVLFLGIHFILSGTPLRGRVVGVIGEAGFQVAFFILAGGAMVWMVVAYGRAPSSGLWHLPSFLAPLFLAVNLIACLLVAAAPTLGNPTMMGMAGNLARDNPVTGFLRITRHPMNVGIALFSLSHVAQSGASATLILFGSIFALAAFGPLGIDARRAAATGDDWQIFAAKTSYLPFAAILAGRNRLELGELGWWRLALGLVLFAALYYFHAAVSGVALIDG